MISSALGAPNLYHHPAQVEALCADHAAGRVHLRSQSTSRFCRTVSEVETGDSRKSNLDTRM